MKRYVWILVAGVIFLVGMVSLYAQKPENCKKPRRCAMMCEGRCAMMCEGKAEMKQTKLHFYLMNKEKLGLTDQQVTNLKKKNYAFMKSMIDIRANLQKEELEMRNLMDTDNVTQVLVLAQLKKIQVVRNDSENKMVGHCFDLMSELTAEQKEKMKSVKCEQKDMDMDREPGCRGMHGGPGHGSPSDPEDKPEQESDDNQ